jgi:hypothetical protein
MTKRVFIIHGWGGVPNSNWFPWLKAELTKLKYEVIVPAMPNSGRPQAKEWISCMNETIGNPTKSDYLVGHSLGVIAILRYLEQLKASQKIGGAVLVAGISYNNLGINEVSSFFDVPVNWNAIKVHCKNFIALHSDDDPYAPIVHSEIFREKLGAKLIVEHGMGHLRLDKFPDVLNAVLEISK